MQGSEGGAGGDGFSRGNTSTTLSLFHNNGLRVREPQALVAPKPPQGVSVRGHAGLGINKLSVCLGARAVERCLASLREVPAVLNFLVEIPPRLAACMSGCKGLREVPAGVEYFPEMPPRLSRNVERFRGGPVFKAHSLLYHSTLALRVIKKKRRG